MPAAPHPGGRQPQPGSRLPSQVVADNVRALREALGRSQAYLAAQLREQDLDWTQSTVSQVELGVRHVNVDELVALAAALRSSPVDLLGPWTATAAAAVEDIVNGREGNDPPDYAAVDLGLDVPVTARFFNEWLRGRVARVAIRPVNGKRGLVEVETTYRTDWYEEPQP
jgi:transcriptional regulator with XRE-family HTH domain